MMDRAYTRAHLSPTITPLLLCATLVMFQGCSDDSVNPPVLHVDPVQLDISRADSSADFAVSNAGGGTLSFTLTAQAPWIRLDLASGSTTGFETISLGIDRTQLQGGPYEAPILVDSNGGAAEVLVKLLSALEASPHRIETGTQDTSVVVELRNLAVNAGVDTLRWTDGSSADWVVLDPSSGVLADVADTVSILIDRSGYGVGVHEARVWFDAGDEGRDTVVVAMEVPDINSVSGHVYYAGTLIPVAGAAVSLNDVQALTAADGSFSLAEVTMGSWTLVVTAEGFFPYEEEIQLPEDGLVRIVPLTSDVHTRTIRGTVRNLRSDPLRQSRVTLLNPDGHASELVGVTAHDGGFVLQGVPLGERRLSIDHPVYDEIILPLEVAADTDTLEIALRATILPPPLPDAGPVLLRVDCGTIRVLWDRRFEDTLAGYRVERAPTSVGPFEDISGLLPPEVAFYNDSGRDLTIYTYRLRSVTIDQDLSEPSEARGIRLEPWSLLRDATTESGIKRWGHTSFYAEEDSMLLVFAGIECEPSGTCDAYRDLWGLDLRTYTWELIDSGAGGPAARRSHVMIHRPSSDWLVIFGGRETFSLYGDTWAFPLGQEPNSWIQLENGSQSPGGRESASAVYDPLGDRMILYAGLAGELRNDVWAFRFATQDWVMLLEGPDHDDGIPEKRYQHTAVYDEAEHRMIVYGGIGARGEYLADTWGLDLDTLIWTRLPDCPVAHRGHAAVLIDDQMIVTGDTDINSQSEPFAWVFDLFSGTWGELPGGSEGTMPIHRIWHTSLFVPDLAGLVVFGGMWISVGTGASEILGDTWSYCPLR